METSFSEWKVERSTDKYPRNQSLAVTDISSIYSSWFYTPASIVSHGVLALGKGRQ